MLTQKEENDFFTCIGVGLAAEWTRQCVRWNWKWNNQAGQTYGCRGWIYLLSPSGHLDTGSKYRDRSAEANIEKRILLNSGKALADSTCVLVMPCVCLHIALPSPPPEKSQANSALCKSELRSRALTKPVGSPCLHTDRNTKGKKRERERKILSLPKRHSSQWRWMVPFSPLSAFLFHSVNVLRLLRRVPGVCGSSVESFNHWLPQPGFNKHRCVLSIFVCGTTLGNQPMLSFKRQGEKTDTLANMLLSFVSFKVVLKVASLMLTGTKDSLFGGTFSTAPQTPGGAAPARFHKVCFWSLCPEVSLQHNRRACLSTSCTLNVF